MSLISLATFNANNFFLRYKFGQAYPGGTQNAAALVADEEAGVGYLPGLAFGRYGRNQYVIWDGVRRELAARALAAPDGRLPDVLCLQEVENIHAVRLLNERHLESHYGLRQTTSRLRQTTSRLRPTTSGVRPIGPELRSVRLRRSPDDFRRSPDDFRPSSDRRRVAIGSAPPFARRPPACVHSAPSCDRIVSVGRPTTSVMGSRRATALRLWAAFGRSARTGRALTTCRRSTPADERALRRGARLARRCERGPSAR